MNYIQIDIMGVTGFDREIRVKGRSTQLTGEQVELAMAA